MVGEGRERARQPDFADTGNQLQLYSIFLRDACCARSTNVILLLLSLPLGLDKGVGGGSQEGRECVKPMTFFVSVFLTAYNSVKVNLQTLQDEICQKNNTS